MADSSEARGLVREAVVPYVVVLLAVVAVWVTAFAWADGWVRIVLFVLGALGSLYLSTTAVLMAGALASIRALDRWVADQDKRPGPGRR